MGTIFLLCATVGGTVLVCQFLLTLIGLGGHGLEGDFSGDVADIGNLDLNVDVGHVDVGFHGDVDVGHVDVVGHVDAAGHVTADGDHADSTSGFKVISFRTVIAGLTFFGLGGLGAQTTNASLVMVLAVAVGSGAAAMYGVYWLFRTLYSLKSEGTLHINNAIGSQGTVYLKIPASDSGAGKVQLSLQSRTAEYLAMTAGEELATGTKIVVVGVVTPTTVQVEPVLEPERNNHV